MSKKVLVVDDDPAVSKIVIRLLEAFNYDTQTAAGGYEAIDLLKQPNDISFVISDMRMPHGDGMELLTMMRQENIKTPFLLITGFADVTSAEALAKGAIGVMTKPFDVNKLMAIIGEHVKQ